MKRNYKTEDALESLREMRDIVGSTFGPQGRTVIIHNGKESLATKDGVTVANDFVPTNRNMQFATDLIKQGAVNTVQMAGDGTTTTTILAVNLYERMSNLNMYPPIEITTALRNLTQEFLRLAQKEVVHIKDEEKDIERIATISANNDKVVGGILSRVFSDISPDGSISVQLSSRSRTEFEIVQGYQFDSGIEWKEMINDPESKTYRARNAMVFVSKVPITLIDELMPILTYMADKPVFIVAPSITGQAKQTLYLNISRHGAQLGFVEAPGFGREREGIIEDIAIMTGAKVFCEGDDFEDIDQDFFGHVKEVVCDFRKTIFKNPNGEDEEISYRMDLLKEELGQAATLSQTKILQKRLTRMSCGIAKIYVGASTRAEANEQKDRIEDAIEAVKNTIRSGYVYGGTSSLLRTVDLLDDVSIHEDESLNILVKDLFRKSCEDLLKRLCNGSGYDFKEALGQIREGEVIDFKRSLVADKDTIIEPFNVMRASIESAVSSATSLLMSNYSIAEVDGE